MAVTIDYTKGAAGAAYPASNIPTIFVMEQTLDFAATNSAAGDDCQALQIRAGSYVSLAGLEIIVVEGGTATGDLGDGDNADGYLDGVDLDATNGDFFSSRLTWVIGVGTGDIDTVAPAAALYGTLGGKFYTADDTIDLTTVNAMDTGKMRVFAIVFDCTGRGLSA